MAKTYYEELGVAPTATIREIKREYRALAQKLHPDQPGGDEAAFIALQKAYDVLSDAEKRAEYDKKLAKAAAPVAAKPVVKPATKAASDKPKRRWRISFFGGVTTLLAVIILILLVRVLGSWSGGIGGNAVTPTPSAIPTDTPTPTETPTDTPTPTPTPTDTPPIVTPIPSPTGEGVIPTITPAPSPTP